MVVARVGSRSRVLRLILCQAYFEFFLVIKRIKYNEDASRRNFYYSGCSRAVMDV